MTLIYKILWIDDRKDFFINHEDFIKDYLDGKGFECEFTKYTSVNEFTKKEAIPEHQKAYDLFLIDLNLDNGDTGDQIIDNIRKNTLVDIIFYSTQLRDVRASVKEHDIEGVYTTGRNKDDFEEKVTDVIDITIRKVQDVNNLRGLIMAEVAELDRIKKEIIKEFTIKNSDHSKLKKYIRNKVFKSFGDNTGQLKYLSAKDKTYIDIDVKVLLDDLIYDSYKKARTVHHISNSEFDLENYKREIIEKRNILAHEKEETRKNGTKFLNYPDGRELEFSEEGCVQIRKDIQKYKQILQGIKSQL